MIRNRRQLQETKRHIERFRKRIAGLGKKRGDQRHAKLQALSYRKMIRQLQDQVAVFEKALQGRIDRPRLEKLLSPEEQNGRPNFGAAIFILRTAKGMTQARLAKKVGTPREVIARWERDDYAGFTYDSLQRVFGALGYQVGIDIRSVAG